MNSNIDVNDGEEINVWYRSPIVHYPLWFIFAWNFIDFIGMLSDYEALFAAGFFVVVTGIWGILAKLFFFRIPLLGRYIYENGYVGHANFILILIGISISLCCILLRGVIVVHNFMQIITSQFKT